MDEILAPGVDGGLGAVGEVEFAEDVADAAFDGVFADGEAGDDFAVRFGLGEYQRIKPAGELHKWVASWRNFQLD